MPGVGFISAATLIAEMGDYRDFSSADKMAKYFGIVPSVYQSAGKLRNGKITKTGSKHMRRILVEVAKAISRTKKNSKLKRFFQRILARCGKKNIAAVALARKVLCILPSFAYESRKLPRARGQENQTKNTQLCFAHKQDGYRRDDKSHQSGRILGGERFEGGMRLNRSILFF